LPAIAHVPLAAVAHVVGLGRLADVEREVLRAPAVGREHRMCTAVAGEHFEPVALPGG
jgi:hypothetical protein